MGFLVFTLRFEKFPQKIPALGIIGLQLHRLAQFLLRLPQAAGPGQGAAQEAMSLGPIGPDGQGLAEGGSRLGVMSLAGQQQPLLQVGLGGLIGGFLDLALSVAGPRPAPYLP